MPTTRSSGRSSTSTSPANAQSKAGAGTKRKAEGTPTKAKRGKKADTKEQKTIDETMDVDRPEQPKREGPDPKDTIVDSDEEEAKAEEKMRKAEKNERKIADDTQRTNGHNGTSENTAAEDSVDQNQAESASKPETEKPTVQEEEDIIEAGEEAEKAAAPDETTDKDARTEAKTLQVSDGAGTASTTNGTTEQVNSALEKDLENAEPEEAVEQDSARAKAEPSNILEKGIIYFFFRGRVGLDDPSSIDEIQRTYIILRPMPSGGKLAESAPIGDAGKNRILALPKKVFPKSRRDTFLCFVEAADSSFETIRDQHLKMSEYATKTQGTRHTPSAKPVAEGIYALTSTGRESHLSYILTVPSELGEVQRGIGLSSRGAFITSVRNPETSAPAGTALPNQAEYPEGIMKDFRGLRWGRLEPAHLDFVNTQFLLIGEGEAEKLEKSVQADKGDGTEEGKEEPLEEMELLEKEDRERIKGLNGDDSDAIFKDLGLNKEEYSKVQTKW